MPSLHPLRLLLFFGLVNCFSAGLYDFGNLELARYDEEVKIIHEQLIEEGCQDVHTEKRGLLTIDSSQVKLEMKKKLYNKMNDMLVECRKTKLLKNKPLTTTMTAAKTTPEKPATTSTSAAKTSTTPTTTSMTTTTTTTKTTPSTTPTTTSTTTTTTKTTPSTTPSTTSTTTTTTTKTTTSTTPTTTSTTTTTPTTKTTPSTTPSTTSTTIPAPTTTTQPPTTKIPQPTECRSAVNLTESWRKNHYRRPKNGQYNCDLEDMVNLGRPWFRFSGDAGNRLLNKCVPAFSCGTGVVLWSDYPTPNTIGVIRKITAYGNNDYGTRDYSCRYYKKKMSIMRCSNKPNDLVYRYDDSADCHFGFCSMSA